MKLLRYLTEDKETFKADKILNQLKDKDRKLTIKEAREIVEKITKNYIFSDIKVNVTIFEKELKRSDNILVGSLKTIRKTERDNKGRPKKVKYCNITLYDGRLYTLIHELAHASSDTGHGESFKNILSYVIKLYNEEC